ncbi:ferritin family protein [Candidatus Woesearchaeota archaeon]|nr:ferritin family protein [Candidatus Woesearchaeota archaeon]
MNEELRQIINKAIKQEEYFYDLYTSGAEKTEVVSAKTLLLKLAREENKHKEKLEELDSENLHLIPGKFESVNLDQELMLTPIDEFKSIKDVFDFAIKSEINANEMYRNIAENVSEDKAKKLFVFLAGEEKKHEELLNRELENLEI